MSVRGSASPLPRPGSREARARRGRPPTSRAPAGRARCRSGAAARRQRAAFRRASPHPTLSAAAPPMASTSTLERDRVARGDPRGPAHAREGEVRTGRPGKSRTAIRGERSGGMSARVLDLAVGHDDDRTVRRRGRQQRGRRAASGRGPGACHCSPLVAEPAHVAPAGGRVAGLAPAASRRGQAERRIQQHQRAPGRAGDGQLTLSSRRPSAAQATARQTSGTQPAPPARSSRR